MSSSHREAHAPEHADKVNDDERREQAAAPAEAAAEGHEREEVGQGIPRGRLRRRVAAEQMQIAHAPAERGVAGDEFIP